jgi:tyrosyl-tRNA synthetase
LQKIIAKEVTTLVHGKETYLKALEASQILFGKSTDDALQKLDTQTFLEIFEGVPQAKIKRSLLVDGIDIVTVLTNETGFFNSKGEARRALNQNAISINQAKVALDYFIGIKDLIANQYILLQRGKKKYFVIKVND